ncbi:MAG: HlyD family efflux transporter periplasmic adaptor subunit [Bacteroidota bacterium]
MKNRKPEILYSDPVREIISDPPNRIVRWGTTLIFSVLVLLALLSWLIKYPDVVPAPVEITTVNPPVTLVSKITGRINRLYVKDGENVSPGELIAVMETAASIGEIERLKAVMDTVQRPEKLNNEQFPALFELGELQEQYASFMKALADYNTYVKNDFYGSKINSVSDEIAGIDEYIRRIEVKERLVSQNLRIEESKYSRDSTLQSTSVYSQSDLEKSRQAFIRTKLELQEVRLDYAARVIALAEKRQLLQDYRIKRQEEKEKLSSALDETFFNLKAQIKIWENAYLLVSPVRGKVAFTEYWSENQSVAADQAVLSVVPETAGDFIGRINLKMQRSGKVKEGQMVNIKLSGYPYLEYGMVRGIVRSKSLVPSGDAYVIEVILPDGLTTLYGKGLDFTQKMQGTAEIITEDLRLIQKIINPFRHLASKSKNS